MSVRHALAALLAGLLVAGCTDGGAPDPTPTPSGATSPPTTGTTTEATTSPSPTPSPSPTDTEVAFGTGTVTIDGVEVPVSGDCDVSREFGDQPVDDLEQDVDVLLAVDNVSGEGVPTGPFAVRVRLLGSGAVTGRTITSEGAGAEDGTTAEATYEGPIDVAELRERRELEFDDVAVLHLEATQDRVAGTAGPASRDLVVDVTCPVSRPG